MVGKTSAMLLLRLSNLTTFSTLLVLAFTHPSTHENEQHSNPTTREPRSQLHPSSDQTRLDLGDRTLSRRNEIIEGYRLSLSQRIQILPISIAAEEIRQFWIGVMVAADARWQSTDHILSLRYGNLQILFETGNENVPLDFTAIMFLASYMKDKVGVGGGWAGLFQGTMMNVATQVAIRVTLRYVGQVF